MTNNDQTLDDALNDLPDFDIELGRRGISYQLPILKSWMPHLAQIALLWGTFEHRRDRFLEKMFTASNTVPPKGWKGTKGKKRHELFLEQVNLLFDDNSFLRAYLHELVADAKIIQNKRNVILHGQPALSANPVRLVIHDYKKDGSVENFEFDGLSLKELFYDISLLVGRFSRISPPYMLAPLNLSSSDISILQRLWGKDYPTPRNSTNTEIPASTVDGAVSSAGDGPP
jgi:hypothetical protein